MSTYFLSVILGFISFVGWGSGDIFGTYSARKIGGIATSLLVSITSFVVSLIVLPLVPHDFSSYTSGLFLFNIFIGLFAIAGNISLNIGLRKSSAPLVGTIAASFTAISIILSILFFHDSVTSVELFSLILIFIGIFVCGFGEIKNFNEIFKDRGIGFAFISMITWGIYFCFTRIVIDKVGWFLPHFLTIILAIITGFILYLKTNESKSLGTHYSSIKLFFTIVMCALLLRAGDFAFNFAISKGFTEISGGIGGSYPILFVILSSFTFGDYVSRREKVGICITLVGLVLLSFFSYHS